jgi:ribosome-associated toxin RatA of RatAB toxin-antitoxin module
MSRLIGTSSAEIKAPLGHVWGHLEDIAASAAWQGSTSSLRPLERDSRGRCVKCEIVANFKVKRVRSILRFTYDQPGLSWTQEQGDLKSLDGRWELEALNDGPTRATLNVEIDFGRTLGMMIKGLIEETIRQMIASAATELKARIEKPKSDRRTVGPDRRTANTIQR